MKFYDTDTHEIFEATHVEFTQYMNLYHEDMIRNMFITGNEPHIFISRCPSLKGHRHFIHKLDEEYTMIKFEDKFVHFRWTDDLVGKKVFYGDSLSQLEARFTTSAWGYVHKSASNDYPFEITDLGNWKFIYYDPNYDCKVAFNEGKQIQGRRLKTNPWMDIDAPVWDYEYEYRIKPGLTWTDLKLGDAVRQFDRAITTMVTAFDMDNVTNHVQLAGWGWVSDTELAEKWFKL